MIKTLNYVAEGFVYTDKEGEIHVIFNTSAAVMVHQTLGLGYVIKGKFCAAKRYDPKYTQAYDSEEEFVDYPPSSVYNNNNRPRWHYGVEIRV